MTSTPGASGGAYEAVVIGAGPAGLATSRELARRGVPHVVLERGAGVGTSWHNTYDSLTLHTGKHMSALPGLRFGREVPLFPSRVDFIDYMERYTARFSLPVVTGCAVRSAERKGGAWLLETSAGEVRARSVVLATGIMANPLRPELPGEAGFGGTITHSADYRRPGPFIGRRVLVVGAGNSAGEIASELAGAGVDVTLSVRSGVNVVPLRLFGIPIQYVAYLVGGLPRGARSVLVEGMRRLTEARRGPPVLPRSEVGPLDRIPLIGFHLVDAVRAGRVRLRGSVVELGPGHVRFQDGHESPIDDIILATGFRAAIQPLPGRVELDARGFLPRRERVVAEHAPGLFVVGHNYDATGGLFNIRRDAAPAARMIAERAS